MAGDCEEDRNYPMEVPVQSGTGCNVDAAINNCLKAIRKYGNSQPNPKCGERDCPEGSECKITIANENEVKNEITTTSVDLDGCLDGNGYVAKYKPKTGPARHDVEFECTCVKQLKEETQQSSNSLLRGILITGSIIGAAIIAVLIGIYSNLNTLG